MITEKPKTSLSEDEKIEAINRFNELIPQISCPMCKNTNFVLADGYFNNVLQYQFSGLSIGGPSIPTIGIICENCGFVSQHALKVINLLPKNLNQR